MIAYILLYLFFGLILLAPVAGLIMLKNDNTALVGRMLIVSGASIILSFLCLIAVFVSLIASSHPLLYSLSSIAVTIIIILVIIGSLWGFIKRKSFYIPLCVCALVCVLSVGGVAGYDIYVNSLETVDENDVILESYAPYGEDTKVATLDETPSLKFTTEFPRMDGATALYPVYSAFARSVYPKFAIDGVKYGYSSESVNDCLSCTTTSIAYERIVDKDTDIIFVAAPSEEQKQYAAQKGVKLVYTPIGKEAFVFFVNSKNPIDNISLEDVQRIYSGEITRWSDLGVSGMGNIRAFQRDEGSGSQSALIRVMGDKPLMEPPTEDVVSAMVGIIERTADYKNFKNAIGYSFRFYSTEMVNNDQIKLLSIGGVYPSVENIENGTYPITSEFYAVIRSDADENTQQFLQWILSDQGQELIEKTGYTSIN